MCRENMAFMVGSATKTTRIAVNIFVNPATQSILIHLAVMTKKKSLYTVSRSGPNTKQLGFCR
jgi:hypothetical protein